MSHGSAVLRPFYINADEKPDWPTYLNDFWGGLFIKGESNLSEWLKTENGLRITNKEKAKLSEGMLVRVYVGSKIDEAILDAQTFANTHVNKHWPKVFKS